MNIEKQQFNNVPVTKENIKTWLKADVQSLYSLAHELLVNLESIEVLADKMYERHLKAVSMAKEKAEKEAKEQITETLINQ